MHGGDVVLCMSIAGCLCIWRCGSRSGHLFGRGVSPIIGRGSHEQALAGNHCPDLLRGRNNFSCKGN
jgi:hypothetical protein